MSELQIRKSNFSTCRIIENDLTQTDLSHDQVLLKIDTFALTSNNITYAVVGEQIRYWEFFPPHSADKSNSDEIQRELTDWGILPVWGYADVVKTNHKDVAIGERVFGYFPPATHLLMKPTKVSSITWLDSSEHRAELPATYNVYRKVESQQAHNKLSEDERMLLYPLHITAFALYDFFQSHDWFGATQLVMLSASSKTSTGLAYGVQKDSSAPSLVALTSARNISMVENLKVYDTALSYEQISQIDAKQATLIVDMSGNGKVLNDLHKHLGENMKFCSNVGMTHWNQSASGPDFIKERSQFFFAPTQLQKRIKEWGMQGFEQKSNEYLEYSIGKSREWLTMTDVIGLDGMAEIFADVCEGKIAPQVGLTIRMP